jgi:hypothetical protein
MNVPFETARDIIQDEPFPYDSMDRLRLMQRPGGLRSMGPINVPMAHGGGLAELPVVKAGFGGFLKKLAPVALAIAAPFVLPAIAPTVFGAGATMFGGALASGTALGTGAMVGLGSGLGSLIAGAKPKDALKQMLISGVTAGAMKGMSNYFTGAGAAGAQGAGNLAKTAGDTSGLLRPEAVSGSGDLIRAGATPVTNLSSMGQQGVGLAYGVPDATTGLGQLSSGTNLANAVAYNPVMPVESGSAVQFLGGGSQFAPTAAQNTAGALSNIGTTAVDTVNPINMQASMGQRVRESLGNLGRDIKANPFSYAAKATAIDLGVPDYDLMYAQEEFDKLSDEEKAKRMYGDDYQAYLPATSSFGTMERYKLPNRNPGGQLPKYAYRPVAQGGQVNRNMGGGLLGVATGSRFAGPQEFSGMVPGDGHGMEDNVYMPIVDRAQGQQVATLAVSPTEYVVDSHTMAALGNGNPNEGAKVMDQKIKEIRQEAYGTTKQPNQIDGARSLESLTV